MLRILVLLFLFPSFLFGQNKPNKVDQIQPAVVLAELNVKKRVGIEYKYTDSTIYTHLPEMKGDTQSIVIFDAAGRTLKKLNKWNYTTSGDLIQSYEYDQNGLMLAKREQIGDSILQKDQFVYSPGGTLLDWNITQGKKHYNQEYKYNNEGFPTIIEVNHKKKTIRKDSILYIFDEQNRPIKEWSYNLQGKIADSLLYSYGEDTLYRKILIIDKELSFIYYKIKFGNYTFDRVEEYTEGHFMGVYSRMYASNGNLLKERNIHHYTNLNYTKNYIYNKDGLLIEKQVFKDTFQPTHIVLYNYEFYQ